MFAGRLTKAEKKKIFETLFELFSVLFILPLCSQNHQAFLDLIWSLHNAKFIPLLFGL
jgi:hypothetical protein